MKRSLPLVISSIVSPFPSPLQTIAKAMSNLSENTSKTTSDRDEIEGDEPRAFSQSEPAADSKVQNLFNRLQAALATSSSDSSTPPPSGDVPATASSQADEIASWIASLNLGAEGEPLDEPEPFLRTDVFGPENTPASLEHVASKIAANKYRRILVLTGAGVSVAAGIPDFRTPGTGLYDNLGKYNLPHPTAVFDVDFYQSNPQPFVTLASEIWPGNHKPTLTHAFIKVLNDKGLLLRNYTQNIDGLEVLAGVPEEKIIECHGHFRSASCCDCNKPADIDEVRRSMIEDLKPVYCARCGGLTKPDIVFFGEDLPNYFHRSIRGDTRNADLLITIGTSLQVNPVASIPTFVGDSVPRILFNREKVGDYMDGENDYRDVVELGDCDSSVRKFCAMLGWEKELLENYNGIASGRDDKDKLTLGGAGEMKETNEEEVD